MPSDTCAYASAPLPAGWYCYVPPRQGQPPRTYLLQQAPIPPVYSQPQQPPQPLQQAPASHAQSPPLPRQAPLPAPQQAPKQYCDAAVQTHGSDHASDLQYTLDWLRQCFQNLDAKIDDVVSEQEKQQAFFVDKFERHLEKQYMAIQHQPIHVFDILLLKYRYDPPPLHDNSPSPFSEAWQAAPPCQGGQCELAPLVDENGVPIVAAGRGRRPAPASTQEKVVPPTAWVPLSSIPAVEQPHARNSSQPLSWTCGVGAECDFSPRSPCSPSTSTTLSAPPSPVQRPASSAPVDSSSGVYGYTVSSATAVAVDNALKTSAVTVSSAPVAPGAPSLQFERSLAELEAQAELRRSRPKSVFEVFSGLETGGEEREAKRVRREEEYVVVESEAGEGRE
ncbi:hypothetical protein JCM8547_006844 [Rhodosporidiobolus lusitaniae]